MEDAELDTTKPGEDASLHHSGFSFDPRTQRLLGYLTPKSERMCNMLKGAWIGLDQDNDNPDLHAQVANSIEELMEKAAKDLTDLPIQLNSGELVGKVRNLSANWKIRAIPIKDASWDGILTSEHRELLTHVDTLLEESDVLYPPNSQRLSALMQALDGSSTPIPEKIIRQRAGAWKKLSKYFNGVKHHDITTKTEDMRNNLIEVERLLLDILMPEVIPVLDEIDTIIDSVEVAS